MEQSIYVPFRKPANQWGRTNPGRGLIALVALSIAGLCLVTARGLLTGNWWFFIMLTWNLFLAFFPLGVVLVLRDLRESGFKSRWLLGIGLIIWLAFLPNAPYIITDLYHIHHIDQTLLWFDTMTIFLFAQTGLLAGLYSTLVAHRMIRSLFGSWKTWILMIASQLLSGFGIYLGRFGRWNSWDLMTKPMALADALSKVHHDHLSLKLTLAYGFVLVVLYVAFWWYVDYERNQKTVH